MPSIDSGPASRHYTITPSNDADLSFPVRAIYFATSGTAAIRDVFGTEITYTAVAGDNIPIRAVRVLSTGTTATVIGWGD